MSDDILSRTPPPADMRLAYGSDPNQFVDLRLPAKTSGMKPPYPLLINIHGGFWRAKYNLEHTGHLCAALTAKGVATANVEYRRVGNGGGWPGTFEDLRSAYRYLKQNAQAHGYRTDKIVVTGHSAGGQLALCLAAHEADIAGVVSLAGVVDLQRAYQLHLSNNAVVEFLHGTPAEVPDHYREADPMQLSIPHARQCLIHGQNDDTVPPAFSRDYVAEKQKRSGGAKEDVHLVEISGADHFDLIDPRSAAWKHVEETVLGIAS
ncbi:MAG: alpha/beta hydrolase family protein [Candidatus Sulfotelmatobacter sp.]